VRKVARFTAVDTDRGVLKQEGPALVGVALQTGLFVPKTLVHHSRPGAHPPGRSGRTVRIVTIGARDDAFVHPVLGWHIELRAYRSMALVAEVDLLLRQ
jgi:hypothetical protein